MEEEKNGSDKNVGSIEKLIEELTKVRPDELSKDGLKLFEYINEIIDRNKELEEQIKYYANEINEIANELEKDGFVGYADEIRDLCIIQDELMEVKANDR